MKICEEKAVISFIRYCISDSQRIPSITDWDALFLFMRQQALLGVGFCGIEKMKAEGADVPKPVVLKWYAASEKIRKRNEVLNRRCVELVKRLKEDGFECCILKGQGNALMYPNPYVRMSGDIDVFVMPVGNVNDDPSLNCSISIEQRRRVMNYVRRMFPQAKIRYQHIDYPVFPDVEVEMHFIPTAKNNPIYNRRLQRWTEKQMAEQCSHFVELPEGAGKIPVPTWEFNIVYQLSHMMHHFFDEGIGLRQLMDYYYLLMTTDNRQQTTDSRRRTTDNRSMVDTLRHLNLYHFAGAVMWVLHEVMGLEECLFIVPADEWRGKLLLEEIIKGGNFGKYSGLTRHGMGTKYFLKINRNMRFVRSYPAEALCEPVFRTWHFFWRMWHKY